MPKNPEPPFAGMVAYERLSEIIDIVTAFYLFNFREIASIFTKDGRPIKVLWD